MPKLGRMRALYAIGTRLPAAVAGSFGALVLSACAAAPPVPTAAPSTGERILVKVVAGTATADDIASSAARVAGVPVRYAAAAGASWHALFLDCRDAAECSAAIARLRTAPQAFAAVEPDGRRHAQ